MHKTKQTLISMIVFFTVFCLTVIINIQIPFSTTRGNNSKAEDVIIAQPNALAEDTNESTEDISIQSSEEITQFSFSEPLVEPQEQIMLPAEDEISEPPKALYANIGISIANSYVKVRKEASTESEVLGKLYKDSAVEVLETKGDWYYVESGHVKGYVTTEYIKTGIPDDELIEKYGVKSIVVAVDGLNVRIDPSTEAKKLTCVYMNETYPVLETKDDWVKIEIPDEGISGYVKTEFTEIIVDFKKAITKEEEEKLQQIEEENRIKKETQIQYDGGVSYSQTDLKLLACLIHSEAGTQCYEGKLAVANVVLNRVKSSKYPDTIKAVVYQSGQFSVASSGSLQKQLDNYSSYSSKSQLLSIKAAKEALEGANNIGSRMYFHSYKAASRKGYDKKSNALKIEDHLFW